jgi:hypothetical protein
MRGDRLLQFYIRTMLMSLLLFAVLVASTLAIGSAQPLNPMLSGFVEGCEEVAQPCWYGITRETSGENDFLILQSLGFELGDSEQRNDYSQAGFQSSGAGFCHVRIRHDRDYGKYVSFSRCTDISLSDLIALFGAPTSVVFRGNIVVTLRFLDGKLLASTELTPSQNWLSPSSRISAMLFDPMIQQGGQPPMDWRGFLPRWRYCQFQPDICY